MKLCRMMSVLLVVLGGLVSDAAAQNAAARATPPSTIPTVSLANVARHGFWYAGGKYVGERMRGRILRGSDYSSASKELGVRRRDRRS